MYFPPVEKENKTRFFAGFLALTWGVLWAACLQWTQWGRWLAIKRTWLTVVVGVGVDLLIIRLLLPANQVGRVLFVFALSSIGIITRSLYNELGEDL